MNAWMGTTGKIHLPLKPKGFPYKEAEQYTRTIVPSNTDRHVLKNKLQYKSTKLTQRGVG